jgi:GMP synthase-like glutamine amidotransferase
LNLLILDNNIVTEHGAPNLQRATQWAPVGERVSFTVRRPPQQDFPADASAFDAVIVSGSKTSILDEAPWITQLYRFVDDWLGTGKPYLGICYGHQVLCRVLGARQNQLCVRECPRPEYGWREIEVLQPSSLFSGLPKKFWTYESHRDEAHVLPAGMQHLARTRDCAIQAVQWQAQSVYGLQFHPETTPATATKDHAHARRHDPKVAQAIFTNFFAQTRGRTAEVTA